MREIYIKLMMGLLFFPPICLAQTYDPGAMGQFGYAYVNVQIPGTTGDILTSIYYPGNSTSVDPDAIPCPVIVWGHNYLRGPMYHTKFAEHLASWGYIVLLPTFIQGNNHQGNAADMKACLTYIGIQNVTPGSIFQGTINTNKYSLGGHGTGGLSAIIGTSTDPRVKCLITADAHDAGLGSGAIKNVHIPAGFVRGAPNPSCNENGSAGNIYTQANPPKEDIMVVGASTCDFEEPTGPACTIVCGDVSDLRRYLCKKYLTAWLQVYLRGDTSYLLWLTGEEIMKDVDDGLISVRWEGVPVVNTPTPTATIGPSATHTPIPTFTPIPTHTAVPTWTPLPTWSPSPTKSPLPSSTPTPTKSPLPTSTPNPAHSSTPTPTATRTPTPFPTPPGPEPILLLGGYWDTNITRAYGGIMMLIAYVTDRDNDVTKVEVFYQGIPTGFILYDNGTHGDWRPGDRLYTNNLQIGAGYPPNRFLLEIQAIDIGGRVSHFWPYIPVK